MTAAQRASVDKRFMKLFADQFTIRLGMMTAEEDRVVVGAEGTGALKDGTVYSNSYGHRFTLTSPQIAAWREHCNTALFAKIVQRMRRSAGCGPELHVGW